jgi:hypothetical protein
MNVFAIIGKIVPWAIAAIAGLLTILGVMPTWWPTLAAAVTGVVQLLISLGPKSTS